MNKKDIAEIKRRLTKHGCTFTRMCGCYVDGEHNKITKIGETFLNLEEDEFYKYLDIAKKVFSGKLGNNILNLEFPMEAEEIGGTQQFLMGLRESELYNDELLDAFYDRVIDCYDHAGNYLILVFHDVYDVVKKTKDNLELDESEEVYQYLIGAICPVELSKPGLGYDEEENAIHSRVRDWVVGMPDTGFVFPAFSERSADIHSVHFYTKDAKNPHSEFMTMFLGCPQKLTATEKKRTFDTIIKDVIGEEDEQSKVLYMDIQGNLSDLIYENEQMQDLQEDEEPEPMVLTVQAVADVLAESMISEEQAQAIERTFEETFKDDLPLANGIVEPKVVEENSRRKDRLDLIQQVDNLKTQLEETRSQIAEQEPKNDDDTVVQVQLAKERAEEVFYQTIDGVRCLVIPLEEEDEVRVNNTIL